ncbi:MAG: DegT/DnrJ/EryC1/StrS family aminotransferase [Desulfatiglandales bacterium]
MQFIDLAAQQEIIRDKVEANIRAVLSHGKYIMGPEITDLEKRLSEYVGVRHAVACSSGTDALLLALMAYGVGPGDVVFTTPFTFIATAEVISLLGAVPVFVDIDPRTFNLDPEHLEKACHALKNHSREYPLPSNGALESLRPKGIIAVDLFGLPADYEAINALARDYGLFVIEDAAQSFGGLYKGKKAGSLGDIGCTSFFPAKPLGGYGDGGMCFTDDASLAGTMRSLSVHGQGTDRYDNVRIGINGRLDSLQAAVLLAKFDIFPKEIEIRQQVAATYTELIADAKVELLTPSIPEDRMSAWAQYSVLAGKEAHRATLQNRLSEAGIPTAVYYPKPLHLQPAFEVLGYRKGDFPLSEDFSHRIFSLPMHPYLKKEDQNRIVEALGGAE